MFMTQSPGLNFALDIIHLESPVVLLSFTSLSQLTRAGQASLASGGPCEDNVSPFPAWLWRGAGPSCGEALGPAVERR